MDETLFKENRIVVYQRHLDNMIAALVHAVAYEKYFYDISRNIQNCINTPIMREGILFYQRKRIADSRLIPLFVKHRLVRPLIFILRFRARKHIKTVGKRTAVKMIYRKNTKPVSAHKNREECK
jgi:hypothetical protein